MKLLLNASSPESVCTYLQSKDNYFDATEKEKTSDCSIICQLHSPAIKTSPNHLSLARAVIAQTPAVISVNDNRGEHRVSIYSDGLRTFAVISNDC